MCRLGVSVHLLIATLVMDLPTAQAFIHKHCQLVHGDLKPENVLVHKAGTSMLIFVTTMFDVAVDLYIYYVLIDRHDEDLRLWGISVELTCI